MRESDCESTLRRVGGHDQDERDADEAEDEPEDDPADDGEATALLRRRLARARRLHRRRLAQHVGRRRLLAPVAAPGAGRSEGPSSALVDPPASRRPRRVGADRASGADRVGSVGSGHSTA